MVFIKKKYYVSSQTELFFFFDVPSLAFSFLIRLLFNSFCVLLEIKKKSLNMSCNYSLNYFKLAQTYGRSIIDSSFPLLPFSKNQKIKYVPMIYVTKYVRM